MLGFNILGPKLVVGGHKSIISTGDFLIEILIYFSPYYNNVNNFSMLIIFVTPWENECFYFFMMLIKIDEAFVCKN